MGRRFQELFQCDEASKMFVFDTIETTNMGDIGRRQRSFQLCHAIEALQSISIFMNHFIEIRINSESIVGACGSCDMSLMML